MTKEAGAYNGVKTVAVINVVGRTRKYQAKLSVRMEGQIKCFSDKVKLKEFIITKPLLYEMLKEPI